MTSTTEHSEARTTAGPLADIGLLVLRTAVGIVLLTHGLQNASDPAAHIATTEQLGVPLPALTGWLSLLGENGLGLLLVLGLATRLAGLLAAVLMTVTWLVTIVPTGLFTDEPGLNTESGLLLAAGGLGIAAAGAGRYSLDALVPRSVPMGWARG